MKEATAVYNNPNLIRRRFYLSKESLEVLDQLALQHKSTPSILLDVILKNLNTTTKNNN